MGLKEIYQSVFPENIREKIARLRGPKKVAREETENKLVQGISYFKENKILFIHIPKAAGISVYKGLFNRDSFGHTSLAFYQDNMSEIEFKECFKFTFVRNPYDRLHSAYYYLKKGGRGKTYDKMYFEILKEYSSFEDFILNGLKSKEVATIQHFCTQTSYLVDLNDEIKMDFIGRFENLNIDYNELRDIIGIGTDLTLENKNEVKKNVDIHSEFSTDMIKVVNKFYQEDFENFNYKMKNVL
ncbi:sulfotransferase family 2 domain-containing protein [Psychroserpens luteus]|uniref:Sulfotransferase family 2 domain-containing protein n=1 Tax=Psychroserpens luteus TaxID=1434066 RepID=A0ABW5ZY48_9FLAO|nr:sulfotransferase family 2 domain-containing protein [Psychroserpens luteus]